MNRSTSSRLAVGLVVALASFSGVAGAEDLDRLEQRAQDLIRQLETELDAVRAERARVERERKALEAERATLEAEKKGVAPGAPAAAAAGPEPAPTETSRKVDILTEEVEQLKENLNLPPTRELKSKYGLGPAASKVYDVKRGLSLGGYGEGFFSFKTQEGESRADALRFVLYTGYKFTDRILLNTELEFEHATTSSTASSSGGSVSLEFGYLDFLGWDWLNARAGLVLVPMGFLNELHEPTTFFGNNRPELERRVIPTTWRELGTGVFGNVFHPDLSYRAYVITSLDAEGFTSEGVRGGRQQGNRALAEDIAGTARLDYMPHQVPGLLLGASAFGGDTGQNQEFAGERIDVPVTLYEVHGQYRGYGLELRGIGAWGDIGDAATLSRALDQTIASEIEGWYLEAGYDVMPWILPDYPNQYAAPFVRYSEVDTQARVPAGFVADLAQNQDIFTVGLSYKPIPQVVLKLDYRAFWVEEGERPDEINVGLGFIF